MTKPAKTKTVTFRISEELYARLQECARIGAYEVSLTSVISRGIELAAQEIERMAVSK